VNHIPERFGRGITNVGKKSEEIKNYFQQAEHMVV
jgi:hypothetical protein